MWLNIKELIAWVRNNWRPTSSTNFANPNLKIKAINVVWDIHRDLVEEELMNILQVDRLVDGDPRIFQQRNTAAKRVLDSMDKADCNQIHRLVELWKTQGYPEHIRREWVWHFGFRVGSRLIRNFQPGRKTLRKSVTDVLLWAMDGNGFGNNHFHGPHW